MRDTPLRNSARKRPGGNARSQALDHLWREYDASREGITEYDNHLFRIRSWNIAAVAIFLGAIFGVDAQIDGPFGYAIAALTLSGVSIFFWLADAYNKSLQMVHILNARELECEITGCAKARKGPLLSRKFSAKYGQHRRGMLANLSEESVLIFYLPVILFGNLVILLSSWLSAQRTFETDWTAAMIGSLPCVIICILLVRSRMVRADISRTVRASPTVCESAGCLLRSAESVEAVK